MKKKPSAQPALSPLENAVMQVVWSQQSVTADAVRNRMQGEKDLKESTVRTLLRRLEGKGYVTHDVEGRTYVYRAKVQPTNVAASAVRGILDRFCKGSVENLLVGLVDDKLITADKLKRLANQIADAEQRQKKS